MDRQIFMHRLAGNGQPLRWAWLVVSEGLLPPSTAGTQFFYALASDDGEIYTLSSDRVLYCHSLRCLVPDCTRRADCEAAAEWGEKFEAAGEAEHLPDGFLELACQVRDETEHP